MKSIKWGLLKNERLKTTRGASFEDIINSRLVAIKIHPHRKGQSIMLFEFKNYIWIAPYIEDEKDIFLKHCILTENIQNFTGKAN